MIDVAATFAKFNDKFLEFKDFKNPPHPRRDISAYLIIDRIHPKPGCDMVVGALIMM